MLLPYSRIRGRQKQITSHRAQCEERGSGGGARRDEIDVARSLDRLAEQAIARSRVESILESSCGACHGHRLTPEDASGGINTIDEIEIMASNGLIQPLSSANSRIVQVMRSGEMPPPGSGPPPVSADEIDFIASYIDTPEYWSGVQPPCSDQRMAPGAIGRTRATSAAVAATM